MLGILYSGTVRQSLLISLVCFQQDGGSVKIGGGSNTSGQTNVVGSAAAAVLRSDSGSGGPPPNVNIASLNLPGVF